MAEGESGPVPSKFEDWHAINTLLMTYAERLDAGRFDEFATLFEHATYRVDHAGAAHVSEYRGAAEVLGFCKQTRLYDDGTPRTKHVITNVNIQLDGDRAAASCYATVFQQTDVLPLQPIAAGRYIDRFERAGGEWRFADRLITGFLLGDRSQHVVWHEGTPAGGAS
jgi:3-phenylpropionate/cinnamic acid dioxygenase small subunit